MGILCNVVNLVFPFSEIFDDDGNGEVDFKEFIQVKCLSEGKTSFFITILLQGISQFSVKGDKETKLR